MDKKTFYNNGVRCHIQDDKIDWKQVTFEIAQASVVLWLSAVVMLMEQVIIKINQIKNDK